MTLAEDATGDDDLVAGIRSGDRRSLARAITLAESTRADHRQRAAGVLDRLMPGTGGAVRAGISGAPGSGKSTFIEALGAHLTGEGRTVAVLAVDPSSTRSGGSILGDKTRMERLARDPGAFVRPSPSGGELGGVARRTREAMLLCEAFGCDVVLVETVGVGQSEVAVAEMTDLFVLLAAPGGGDDLQGIKRGIMELADLVLVTKADGALSDLARHACADVRASLGLLRPKWPGVDGAASDAALVSSTTGDGVVEAWDRLSGIHDALRTSGALEGLRARQAQAWLWSEVRAGLADRLRSDRAVAALLPEVEAQVAAGDLSPSLGAHRLLETFRRSGGSPDT